MRMKVICGDEECREEFFVDSKEHIWTCPGCNREIENRNYPFLTAKLMQAKIDGSQADWKTRYEEIIEEAAAHINERSKGKEPDMSIVENARKKLQDNRTNSEWRELHDEFLIGAREFILKMEK